MKNAAHTVIVSLCISAANQCSLKRSEQENCKPVPKEHGEKNAKSGLKIDRPLRHEGANFNKCKRSNSPQKTNTGLRHDLTFPPMQPAEQDP